MTRKEWQRGLRHAVALTAMLTALACTKQDTPAPRGGTGGSPQGSGGSGGSASGTGGTMSSNDASGAVDLEPGTLPDVGSGSGSVDTATTPPMTCAAIRNCVTACKQDSACKARCPTMAPPAARSAFMAIETCSKKACPTGDEPCRCEVECLAGGTCTDMVDVCRDFEDDVFCDVDCH
jgi:hypothetical protein